METYLDPNVKEVSGPTNVVRLEGEIDGVKKVLYTFMDFHLPLEQQNQCDNIYSYDIKHYMIEQFKKTNLLAKKFDFFLEVDVMDTIITSNTEIYLTELRKLFKKIFVYNHADNKVSISKSFPNLRFHYMDIRYYFGVSLLIQFDKWLNNNYFNTFLKDNHQELIQLLQTIEFNNLILMSAYYHRTDTPQKISILNNTNDNNEPIVNYLIYKLFTVKNTLLKTFIETEMEKLIQTIKTLNTDIKNYIKEIQDNVVNINNKKLQYDADIKSYNYQVPIKQELDIMTKMFINLIKLHNNFLLSRTIIMDLFFMHRFVDKNYITNAITYTGYLHSINYIYYLIKTFNFKITHASYLLDNTIDTINNTVKNTLEPDQLTKIFQRETVVQCSDITHFPDNFE